MHPLVIVERGHDVGERTCSEIDFVAMVIESIAKR
jgi:hypothetical protein